MSDLSLTDVTVRRGKRIVLDGVTTRFAAGRLTVIIGPNGAGKSSLLDIAAGLLVPETGEAQLGGVALASIGLRALARRRAYLPQNPRVDWPISVEHVVALGLTPVIPAFGDLPAEWQPRIEVALESHDLLALRDRPATQLSGGELARTMLARATIADPELLLVDEPTAGLDPRHALDAARRLRVMADAGRTVVVALHDLDLALRIADDVVAVRDGRIVAQGKADAIFTEGVLRDLYEVPVRISRDEHGASVRFLA